MHFVHRWRCLIFGWCEWWPSGVAFQSPIRSEVTGRCCPSKKVIPLKRWIIAVFAPNSGPLELRSEESVSQQELTYLRSPDQEKRSVSTNRRNEQQSWRELFIRDLRAKAQCCFSTPIEGLFVKDLLSQLYFAGWMFLINCTFCMHWLCNKMGKIFALQMEFPPNITYFSNCSAAKCIKLVNRRSHIAAEVIAQIGIHRIWKKTWTTGEVLKSYYKSCYNCGTDSAIIVVFRLIVRLGSARVSANWFGGYQLVKSYRDVMDRFILVYFLQS